MPGVMAIATPLIWGVAEGAKAIGRKRDESHEEAAKARHIAHPIEIVSQAQPLAFLSNGAGEVVK